MFKIVLFVLSLAIIWNCSSHIAFSGKKESDVDSVLFYQQADITDSFIDSILTDPGDVAQINMTLFPPPPIRETVKQQDGFRVQVFAGLDSSRAVVIKNDIHQLVSDTVYVVKDVGLYKAQVGDFIFRAKADSVQRLLTINGVQGSWVVKRLINVLISPPSSDPGLPVPAISEDYKYKIQILATAEKSKASALVELLNLSFSYPAYYLHSGGIYKVYLGKFHDRSAADAALEQARSKGYPDAWLVY